jgi:hypothetical protein
MAQWSPYTKTQDFIDGKVIDETAGASAVSLEDEYQEIEDKLGAIPAITDSLSSLTLVNGIAFGHNFATGISNLNNSVFFPEGTTYTQVLAAVQAAVTNGGGIVFFPPGTYNINDEIADADVTGTLENIIFMGAGRSSILEYNHTLVNDMFDCAGNSGIQFHNLQFTFGTAATASGWYINNIGPYFVGSNLWFTGGTDMQGAINCATGQVNTNVTLHNIHWSGECDGAPVYCTRIRGGHLSELDLTVNAGTPTACLYFDENSGSNEDVTIDGLRLSLSAGSGNALSIDPASTGNLDFTNIRVTQSIATAAIKLGTSGSAGANNVTLNGGSVACSDTGAFGIDASNTTDCDIIGMKIIQSGGTTGTSEGIRVDNHLRLSIQGGSVRGWNTGIDNGGNAGTGLNTNTIVTGSGGGTNESLVGETSANNNNNAY